MTSATFCNISIIFFMSLTLFWFVLYICQVLLTTDKYNLRYWGGRREGGWISPSPPGPEGSLKDLTHIGLNGHSIRKFTLKLTFRRYFAFVSWYECIMSDLPNHVWIAWPFAWITWPCLNYLTKIIVIIIAIIIQN